MKQALKAAGKRCPNCGATEDPKYAPFCSKRCSDVDLGRWLKGAYRIPGEPAEPEDVAAALQQQADAEEDPDEG